MQIRTTAIQSRFISRLQFLTVYNRFRRLAENSELDVEQFQNEMKLLLEYFRCSYNDSERKTNKIFQMITELSKCKETTENLKSQREKDKEIFKEKLLLMEKNLNSYKREEKHLIQMMEKLKADIEALRALERVLKPKTKNFIEARESITPKILKRDIGITCNILVENSSIDLIKKQSSTLITTQEIDSMKRIYETEIERLENQIKIKNQEAKFRYSEVNNLKKQAENKNNQIFQLRKQLTDVSKLEEQEKELLLRNMSSSQATIDGLLEELNSLKHQNSLLQQDCTVFQQKRNSFLLQIQERDKDIGNMKNRIDSLMKSKESAIAKAELFEENLATDKNHIETSKKDIDLLNKTVHQLRDKIKSHESQLNQQQFQRKDLEATQKIEILDLTKRNEYYQAQIGVREKRIKILTLELEESQKRLAISRRQFRDKRRHCADLSEELQKWKKAVGFESENLQSLRQKLKAMESANSALQSELKFTKAQYFLAMKERNKFETHCKQMNNIYEYRELRNRMLMKQHELSLNTLKIRDQQKEILCKRRREVWCKR
ncbi:uncharacterized protein NPIL_696581 [Nephila pilipes]|uniref:Uncharacterized protein n=1 Tax=Nephila pilipes TaxID=299642 RepID=A0A8X6QB44_NEPPI|nr:uncharacterized protein NPIL_696581 [Nephila pilipes]